MMHVAIVYRHTPVHALYMYLSWRIRDNPYRVFEKQYNMDQLYYTDQVHIDFCMCAGHYLVKARPVPVDNCVIFSAWVV